MVSGPGKKRNRAVMMRLRSWHLLLGLDFSWVQKHKVHIRRDWGPAAHTCLWVPPPLSGSHVVWPFFFSSVLNHLSPASALLGFNPSLHLFGVFVPLPLSASFCLCNSSSAANVFPLQNLPSPDSSTPFSSLLTPRLFLLPSCSPLPLLNPTVSKQSR